MKPCGTCVKAEYADEDSDGLAYVAKPGATTAHLKRPSGSEGSGSPWAVALRSARGRQTYCGMRVGDDWQAVAP